jgi:hypothetical protein
MHVEIDERVGCACRESWKELHVLRQFGQLQSNGVFRFELHVLRQLDALVQTVGHIC